MRPKITIVSPVFPYRGGIANFSEALYSRLSEIADVRIINFKRQYPSFLFPGKTQLERNAKKNILSDRLVDSINPFNWFSVGKKIRRNAPDFLLFAYWHPFFAPAYGVIGRLAKKNGKTKIAALCHNVLPHERNFLDVPLSKFFFGITDYQITLSEKVVTDLRKLIKNPNYKTLFHPIYDNFGAAVNKTDAREKLGLNAEDKIILFFGFVRKYKGLDVLLRSAAVLKKRLDFKLLVAGEFYDNKNEYLKIIEELALRDNVIIHDDFIPSDEVKYWFSAADVVALPYKSATQSGIVQMAYNFGKPVVATDVGGLGEMIKNGANGFVVPPNDPQAFADALYKFYEEKSEDKFSANVKVDAEKYSWEKFASELLDFLQK